METIKLTYPHQLLRDDLPETIAAIGFFDGLHKGHREVIQQAVQLAKNENKKSSVISFFPHPSLVLKKNKQPMQYLTLLEEKEALLAEMNVDRLYVITFNEDLSQLSPAQFIEHFIHGLHITHVFAGFDFTFGHKGSGNIDNFHTYTNKMIQTTKIASVDWKEEPISSSRIRELIVNGDVTSAKEMLGRPYTTVGKVIHGDSRGSKIGFPTANLEIDLDKLLPKRGVYAVKVIVDGSQYEGMANIGVKPTFTTGKAVLSVEVNIFDFNRSIYGEKIIVEWHHYIREEKKFNGIEEIVEQLHRDKEKVEKYFTSR